MTWKFDEPQMIRSSSALVQGEGVPKKAGDFAVKIGENVY